MTQNNFFPNQWLNIIQGIRACKWWLGFALFFISTFMSHDLTMYTIPIELLLLVNIWILAELVWLYIWKYNIRKSVFLICQFLLSRDGCFCSYLFFWVGWYFLHEWLVWVDTQMLVPSRFWLLTCVSLGYSIWEAELMAPFLGCGEDEGDSTR